MDMIAGLLAERERQGLKQLLIASLMMVGVIMVLNIFFLPDTPVRGPRILGWTIPIGGSLFTLWLLRYEKMGLVAGLLFALLATSYFAFSGYTNYLSLGPGAFPPTAIVRLMDNAAMGMIVAATALTLRPALPVITSILVVGTYVAFLIFALNDPRSVVGVDYADFLTEGAILRTKEGSNIVYPLLIGVIVAFAVRNARDITRRAVRLEVQNRDLSRYFSPNVVAKISSGGADANKLGGKRQDVVVMFSDMEGFTSLSANLQPEEALSLLSDYQERMVEAIFANQGTLDKFIGDGIMATFGTPDPDPNAAFHAVSAAQAMEEQLTELNEARTVAGLQPIRHRIGIHAGPALVGNVGTAKRLEFTVIGDSVNVASRVERACKELGESLLVSKSIQEKVGGDFTWRAAGETSVAGHAEGLKLFAPETKA